MLRVLPPEPVLQQIRLVTGLNVGCKMRNIAIQLVLQQCCKSSCTFFCTLNIVLAPFKFCTNSLLPTSPPPPNLAYVQEVNRFSQLYPKLRVDCFRMVYFPAQFRFYFDPRLHDLKLLVVERLHFVFHRSSSLWRTDLRF